MVIWFKSSAMLNLLFAYMQAGTRPLKYEHMDTPQYIKCMINRGYMGTATALIQAVECAAPDLVKTLLANGADVHQIDRLGRTAMMMAARQLLRYAGPRPETKESHDVEMICAELLLHGADPCGSDEAGHNAFFYAGDERSRFAELVEKETLRRRKDAEDRRKAAEDRRKAVRDDSTAAADSAAEDSAAEDTSAEDDSTSAEDDSTATADDSIAIEDDNIAAEDIAAEDDSTAVDGESNAQATAVVEDDTQAGVERAQETVVKGGSTAAVDKAAADDGMAIVDDSIAAEDDSMAIVDDSIAVEDDGTDAEDDSTDAEEHGRGRQHGYRWRE